MGGQEEGEQEGGVRKAKNRWYSLCWQINRIVITNVPSLLPSYLMHKLDSVLEYGHEIGQAKVSHLLHHWIRVHLKTAVGGAQEVT